MMITMMVLMILPFEVLWYPICRGVVTPEHRATHPSRRALALAAGDTDLV